MRQSEIAVSGAWLLLDDTDDFTLRFWTMLIIPTNRKKVVLVENSTSFLRFQKLQEIEHHFIHISIIAPTEKKNLTNKWRQWKDCLRKGNHKWHIFIQLNSNYFNALHASRKMNSTLISQIRQAELQTKMIRSLMTRFSFLSSWTVNWNELGFVSKTHSLKLGRLDQTAL